MTKIVNDQHEKGNAPKFTVSIGGRTMGKGINLSPELGHVLAGIEVINDIEEEKLRKASIKLGRDLDGKIISGTMTITGMEALQLKMWLLETRFISLFKTFRTNPDQETPVPTNDIRDLIHHLEKIDGVDCVDVDMEDQVIDIYVNQLYDGRAMICREIMYDCSKWIELFSGEVMAYMSQDTGHGINYLTNLQDNGVISKRHPEPEYTIERPPAPDAIDIVCMMAFQLMLYIGQSWTAGYFTGAVAIMLIPIHTRLFIYLYRLIRPIRVIKLTI